MKLQPALIFGEHMLLQRQQPIPVWGRSVRNDKIIVTLGDNRVETIAVKGQWKVVLPAMEAAECVTMSISSSVTGETIVFNDIAIGEVWLAGGQSNMEFLLKYDEEFETLKALPEDPSLRFFRYPQANFPGMMELNAFADDGFWRIWKDEENKGFFSGPAAYMGMILREKLGVPVGIVGCNWGGTPAAAWTKLDDIKENPCLRSILEWQKNNCETIDFQVYYPASEIPTPEPTEEERKFNDFLMMGGDFKEVMPVEMPDMSNIPYSPFKLGPRACVRPGGLYESMLSKVAPYAIRGVVWYQGEDDDARDWVDFYDESMKTMIDSWRNLWGTQLPFLQVELAPFEGYPFNCSKRYPDLRHQQRKVMDELPNVHNICIMDSGDRLNIHVRKKRPVGTRLALLALKYVYGEEGLTADSPRAIKCTRIGKTISVKFKDTGSGLQLYGDPHSVTKLLVNGKEVQGLITVSGDCLHCTHDAIECADEIRMEFEELNYCEAVLFGETGLPAFPFTLEINGDEERLIS